MVHAYFYGHKLSCTIVTTGLMIMASHRIFSGKLTICPAKSKLTRQIYYTMSIENSLSLQKKMNYQLNIGTVTMYFTEIKFHVAYIGA